MIFEAAADRLADYADVPIRFEVKTVYEVQGDNPKTAKLVERPVDSPWIKDYDGALGNRPASWPRRWDVSNWGVLAAALESVTIGGAVIAWNTPGVSMLAGRRDLAVLWDIRVHPDARGLGVGTALFEAASTWARARGCREMHIETQNINVPACRFYARTGCRLIKIDRRAYAEYPEEIQLIWAINLELYDR